VLIRRRHAGQYASLSPMGQDRDFFVGEVLAGYRGAVVHPVSMPAEAQHSSGGYLACVAGTARYYQDIHHGGHILVRHLRSPNTVRGHATSLAQWWSFLEQRDEVGQRQDAGVPRRRVSCRGCGG
jgi:hypothetical protein